MWLRCYSPAQTAPHTDLALDWSLTLIWPALTPSELAGCAGTAPMECEISQFCSRRGKDSNQFYWLVDMTYLGATGAGAAEAMQELRSTSLCIATMHLNFSLHSQASTKGPS
jgi:hypothetical protein